MKKLPIDIISANCLTPKDSLIALDYCTKFFKFNNSTLFTSEDVNSSNHKVQKIEKFKTIDDYSNFILRLYDYVESDYVLIIQDDGFITNPDKWSDSFLEYDYIGAPWPTSKKFIKRWDDIIYQNSVKNIKRNRVGNGGFSLRSKKFLKYASQYKSTNKIAEDVFLCLINYEEAIKNGIKFAPFQIAYQFSSEVSLKGFHKKKEAKNKKFQQDKHFGFHGKRFLNSEEIIKLKYS